MRTEARFLLAIGLILLVLVGTNLIFPPVPSPDAGLSADSLVGGVPGAGAGALGEAVLDSGAGAEALPTGAPPAAVEVAVDTLPSEREVLVEGPLYQFRFSSRGAALLSAQLTSFPSLRSEGPVQLIPSGSSALGHRLVVGQDTLDLRSAPFEVSPSEGLRLSEGDSERTLSFSYRHPAGLGFEVEYTFHPESYIVEAAGQVTGLDRSLLVTDLGAGVTFTEADSASEARLMAYVGNHLEEGIRSEPLERVDQPTVEQGPFRWAAFKSKFFVVAFLAGDETESNDVLGGLLVSPLPEPYRAQVAVTQVVGSDRSFDYRVFVGPQEFARLSALGSDLEEVNPYGWRFFRPVIRPFVGVIIGVLTFLHNTLNWGYGWVLILFGVLMRVVLWPLNQKAMKAQMRNMAVQPLLKEIQGKYQNNPERLQQEMMKLYKEYGFNPLAGCLPMLLPWPILIALFFVFQNTIEFRGVPFLWLPDLSAPDPFYVLPIFLAVSMFLLQLISLRSMGSDNPQMKMMLWFMPIFFGFLFMKFAAGLNLYYATANIATLPQQYWIAKERKRAQAQGPVKLAERK